MNGKKVHIYLEDKFISLNGIDEINSWAKVTEKNPIIYLLESEIDISKIYYSSDEISISNRGIVIYNFELDKELLEILESRYKNSDILVSFFVKDMESFRKIASNLKEKNIQASNLILYFSSEEKLNEEDFKEISDYMSELDIEIVIENDGGIIYNGICKSKDRNFIRNALKYGLANKLEINNLTHADKEFIKELSDDLSEYGNIYCTLGGVDFLCENIEISCIYKEFLQKSRTVNFYNLIDFKNFIQKSMDPEILVSLFQEEYDVFKECSLEETRVALKELDSIVEVAREKSQNQDFVQELIKVNKEKNFSLNGIQNLIKISSIYDYFVRNYFYDNLACTYIHLKSLEADDTEANEIKYKESRSKLSSSEKHILDSKDEETLERILTNATTAKCLIKPHKAVCCGIAIAMLMALNELGINAKFIGSESDELGDCHAYVIAEIEEEKWIKLDPTWDLGKRQWEWFGFISPGSYPNSVYHTPVEGNYSNYIGENDEFILFTTDMIKVLQQINTPKKNLTKKLSKILNNIIPEEEKIEINSMLGYGN